MFSLGLKISSNWKEEKQKKKIIWQQKAEEKKTEKKIQTTKKSTNRPSFYEKKPQSKQSIICHKNTERKVANIAEKLHTYQNRVLAQNSHKKFVGVVSKSNVCHALFSKQKCWHNLPKNQQCAAWKHFFFSSIPYIIYLLQ